MLSPLSEVPLRNNKKKKKRTREKPMREVKIEYFSKHLSTRKFCKRYCTEYKIC